MRLMGDRFLNILNILDILRGGVEVVDIVWHHKKKLQRISLFSLSVFRVSFLLTADQACVTLFLCP